MSSPCFPCSAMMLGLSSFAVPVNQGRLWNVPYGAGLGVAHRRNHSRRNRCLDPPRYEATDRPTVILPRHYWKPRSARFLGEYCRFAPSLPPMIGPEIPLLNPRLLLLRLSELFLSPWLDSRFCYPTRIGVRPRSRKRSAGFSECGAFGSFRFHRISIFNRMDQRFFRF